MSQVSSRKISGSIPAHLGKVATSPLTIKPQKSEQESTHEIQLSEEDDGEYDGPHPPVSGASSIHSGPNWVYGTTTSLPRTTSISSVSGLCLTERGQITVPQPEVIQNLLFPSSDGLKQKIMIYREKVRKVLNQDLDHPQACKEPLLVITGPSYIKDVAQVKACAQWIGSLIGKKSFHNNNHNHHSNDSHQPPLPTGLNDLLHHQQAVKDDLLISIRTNLSNYNHAYNDPNNKSSIMTFEIEHGIPICRALLCELAEICPIIGETCDTITPQYLNDLYCLGLVSSTLIESQLHRELASGVSYPVGFNSQNSELPFDKSMYRHKITAALDAMYATSQPHQFLSVTKIGTVAVVGTTGNEDTFIILQLNLQLDFDELKAIITQVYSYKNLTRNTPRIMIDVGKVSNHQYESKLSLLKQLFTDLQTKHTIVGVMIDSGDNYIPDGYSVEMLGHEHDSPAQDDSGAYEENNRKLVQLQKSFMKTRISKGIQKKLFKTTPKANMDSELSNSHRYENLVNANKFISELNELSKARRK